MEAGVGGRFRDGAFLLDSSHKAGYREGHMRDREHPFTAIQETWGRQAASPTANYVGWAGTGTSWPEGSVSRDHTSIASLGPNDGDAA
jgi:hypothetical protein